MRHLITKMVCIGLLAAGWVFTVSAQVTNAPKAPVVTQPAKAAKHTPFKGKITLVDKVAKTVTLQGEKHQVIHITSQTKITKSGQPATFEGLAVGANVTGSKIETATDKWEATSLKIVEAKK